MGWEEDKKLARGARPNMVRTRNERVLLDLLRAHGAMTRQQLAEGLSLTLPAIAGITASLSDAGMVREYMPEQVKGARGRPPLIVEFLPESSFVIAVRLGRVETKIMLTDALGEVKAERDIPYFEDAGYQAVLADLIAEIKQVIAAYPAAINAPKTLGLCVQGTLDLRTGTIVDAPRMDWRDVPLITDLQAALSMPVYGIEAGRAAAVSELIDGKAQGYDNVVVIDIGAKVSAAVILEGRIISGAQGLAGSLGECHFPNAEDGAPDYLVNDVLSTQGAYETYLKDHPGVQKPEGSAREAVDAALAGDEAALNRLLKAGEILGYAVGWVANLFNPQLIVLSGGIAQVPDGLRAPLIDAIMEQVGPALRADLKIEFSELGLKGWERGAVFAGLQNQSGRLSRLFDRPADL